MAGAVHVSERQLRRRVAERTGKSPLVWLRERRLLEVRRLIDSGTCTTLPTLSSGGLALLAAALGLFGWLGLRRVSA
jgi:methylphosphotriester-DNA--protein-cysteine methyltransferase